MTQHHPIFQTLLILQPIEPLSLLDQLRELFAVVHYYPLPPFQAVPLGAREPSPEEYAEADCIFSFTVPANLTSIAQTPRLKLFQALSAGYGHITSTPFVQNLPADHPLIIASASGIHVSAIGEHSIATTMMLFHKLHELVIIGHEERRWIKAVDRLGGHYVRELRGQTVGIIGYGHIGAETARMAHAFGSTIVALTRSGVRKNIGGYHVPHTGDLTGALPVAYYSSTDPASVASFLGRCDVVVNTLPSEQGTKDFIGRVELTAMKGDAVLVNIGRGDTVDTDALVEALGGKAVEGEASDAVGTLRIGGVSLDVTAPEPLPDGHPLWSLSNAIITPHCSGLSRDYFVRAVDLLTINVQRIEGGLGALNAVRGKGE